jgi:hypothetical protein
MEDANLEETTVKVFYRPIEAAVRWCGMLAFEPQILVLERQGSLPERTDITGWQQLRLNLARIQDALVNGDLRYGLDGVTCTDANALQHPDLTIRHVDLKEWMLRFYPDQRPSFLFDAFERHLHPAISVAAVQALIADREALKIQLADRLKAWDELQAEFQTLTAARDAHAANRPPEALGPRSETTYLNIVGGLLTLILGKSPNGVPYSRFETQEAVVSALTEHFGDRAGMSERTLWAKFAAAKRHLAQR